ncbi:hypothetical protein BDA99DRAFT_562678 [Phascolomyces articulosus]|uniref:Uncharacterized protein n=1 Tax=Phascolomyces articulosus TaxID=60185 RepID=A0AAD5JUL4_9FUNG|nr:hypothetical protein BDA99DRAFT_562678 [Phascolomyces articulosus]
MLSLMTRRTLVTSKTTLRTVTPVAYRCYTVIPSTPQAKQQPTILKEDENPNPIHALYNDTESMVDSTTSSHHSAPQHNIASDVFGSSSTDTFSPTFNTVFDE